MKQREKYGLMPTLLSEDFFPNFLSHFSILDDDRWKMQESSNLSLSEDENTVCVEAHLPGVLEKNIEITLDKGTLWIKGSAEEKEEDAKKKYYYRANRAFSYRLPIPGKIDETKEPEATYENGVISIVFPKQEKEVPKKIQIHKNG